jgi:hypothetical protein
VSVALWSWLAAGVSIVGLWVSGHSPRVGWVYGIAAQAVWVAYGLSTGQPGMLALSAAFVVIYARNLHRWRGTRFVRAAAQPPRAVDDEQPHPCLCGGRS